jgi:uncharacterized protein
MGAGAGGLGVFGLLAFLLVNLLGGGGAALDPGFSQFEPGLEQDGPPLTVPADGGDDMAQFAAFVISDVQAYWEEAFRKAGETYQPTELVLFDQGTNSGCGPASSATGPFYCPADELVYVDLSFFRELAQRFEAPGDFAQAYVIAHEVAHHVQHLRGTDQRVRAAQREDPGSANELSIAMELQADCLSGVWAQSAFEDQLLESGDLEEALDAAAAVGDDRIQLEPRLVGAAGPVVPHRISQRRPHPVRHVQLMGSNFAVKWRRAGGSSTIR